MLKRALALSAFIFLLFPSLVLAQGSMPTAKKISTLSSDSVVNHDYFAAGQITYVSGTVNGDAYAAGGQVIVDGNINGQLLVAGGNVTISGNVTGNVRAAGGQLLITGNVGKNISVAGGNVEFANSATLGGNIAAAAGSVVIDTPVKGSINAAVGNLHLSSNANVSGDINYVSKEDLSMSDTATVSELSTKPNASNVHTKQRIRQTIFCGFGMFATISSIVTTLIISFLILNFLPNFTQDTANLITKKFPKFFRHRIFSIIAIPVFCVVLLIIILGI